MTHLYHIILVDDDEPVAVLLETVIKTVYPMAKTSYVTNGRQALQVYEQSGADLIISDRDMAVWMALN